MIDEPFADLLADAKRRVEHGERILEDQADARSRAAAVGRSGSSVHDVNAVEKDATGRRPALQPAGGPSAASAMVLLPEPDSPTTASVDPLRT